MARKPGTPKQVDALRHGEWRTFRDIWARDVAHVGVLRASLWAGRYGVGPLLPPGWRHAIRATQRSSSTDRSAWLAPSLRRVLRERRRHPTGAKPSLVFCGAGRRQQ
mgnify:CR=1 FL=1